MNVRGWETAPLATPAEVVTNSLHPDVSRKTFDFSSGPPPDNQRERESFSPKRISVSTAIPSPYTILSGVPL